MKSKRLGRTRLSVDIPDELHEDIRHCANIRNITITQWVLRACYKRMKEERIIEESKREKDYSSE